MREERQLEESAVRCVVNAVLTGTFQGQFQGQGFSGGESYESENCALDFLSWHLCFASSLSGIDCRHSPTDRSPDPRRPAQRPGHRWQESVAEVELQ